MQNQVYSPDEFVTSNVLNAQVNSTVVNFQSISLGQAVPGLISPTAASYTLSGLSITASLPQPFQVLFGTGILAQAHGAINGAETSSYTTSFSGVVPAAGFPPVTAYLVATYQQIQQNPVVFIGPPPGHPDFNPNYVPATQFTQVVDSLNVFATVAPPDNSTSFELFRCTLASGATGLGTLVTSFQQWAASLNDLPIINLGTPGTLVPMRMNNITTGGTYTLPNAGAYNSNILTITCNTPSLVTINSPNNVYGYFAQGANGILTFNLPQGGTTDLEAINGVWQIIGGNALGLGIPVQQFPVTVPQGGTGLTSLPAHTVLLGEGTANVGSAGPGTAGMPLVGQGPSADPVFGAINLNSGAVTNVLQIGNGGSGNTSYNAWGTLIYNGNTGTFTTVVAGTLGAPLIAQGSAAPAYQALNLGLGPTSITGTLPIGFGGTGASSFTPFGTIAMNNTTGTLVGLSPGNAGYVLTSNGNTLPSFQPLGVVNPQWLVQGFYYSSPGSYNLTVPSWAGYAAIYVWGGGGGGSGSNQGLQVNIGASGGGGGYSAGFGYQVTPGQNMSITVGVGGTAAANGGQAGSGGNSSVAFGSFTLTGNGGVGGAQGPGQGGSASGGVLNFVGQGGCDLDGLIGSGGSNMFAIGGSAGGGGGGGGNINAAGVVWPAQAPGGGGGANYYQTNGGLGAAGAVYIVLMSSTMPIH